MLEFKLENEESVAKKARYILKLKKEKTKNQAKFASAFQELLKNKSLAAVLALSGDEVMFSNDFKNKTIKLTKTYGIKSNKFVVYYQDSAKPQANNEDFEEDASFNTNPSKWKCKSIKIDTFIKDIMNDSLDLEPIYDAWVTQLIELGNKVMSNPELQEDDGDDVDDFDDEDETDETSLEEVEE